MRVLLTGATSFSGYWFAATLGAAGVEVVAPVTAAPSSYTGVRAARVARLAEVAQIVPNAAFGTPAFMELVAGRSFDLLCHHGARVTDYRSLDFDVVQAVHENTRNLRDVLAAMTANGLRAVVYTGTVFEAQAGAGERPLRAVSPYGLSKGLTAEVIRFWCGHHRVPFGKFVIANPFGPFEEPRFCAYLIATWRAGEVATVRTPAYLRDNIHVDLLALAYVDYLQQMLAGRAAATLGPMGYVESQGAFAERFAAAMRPRLGWRCELAQDVQAEFPEPRVRINTDAIDAAALRWSEPAAWDRLAEYYRSAA